MSRRSRYLRLAALGLSLSVTLAGCGMTETGQAATGSQGATDLSSVAVAKEPGADPTVTVPTPFTTQSTSRTVLTRGTGPLVAAGQLVTVDYAGFNGTDGHKFTSSFGTGTSPSFVLDPKENLPGLVKGITGVPVGSRLLIAIPPADGYGTAGLPSAAVGPTDTIIAVIDVKGARTVLTRAKGTAAAAKPGLPKVTLAANGAPRITLPSGPPPTTLVAQPLIVGTGPKVAKGQQIRVHYTGVVWPGGTQFDSSWEKGVPATFGIGQGRLIAAWDETLVNQPVGSQLLLVVPPDKGYGAEGSPDGKIKGTDTLVFVIDILDAT